MEEISVRYERKKAEIHERYLPKTQRIIDVLESCVTPEQIQVCMKWEDGVLWQWERFEMEKTTSSDETLAVIHEMRNLREMVTTVWNRILEKRQE